MKVVRTVSVTDHGLQCIDKPEIQVGLAFFHDGSDVKHENCCRWMSSSGSESKTVSRIFILQQTQQRTQCFRTGFFAPLLLTFCRFEKQLQIEPMGAVSGLGVIVKPT